MSAPLLPGDLAAHAFAAVLIVAGIFGAIGWLREWWRS